eukprot:COSAG04_NODE_27154_length_286_cov_0.743316_1_plen_69_part_01
MADDQQYYTFVQAMAERLLARQLQRGELETLLSFTGPPSRAGCEAVAFEEAVAMAEEAVEEVADGEPVT